MVKKNKRTEFKTIDKVRVGRHDEAQHQGRKGSERVSRRRKVVHVLRYERSALINAPCRGAPTAAATMGIAADESDVSRVAALLLLKLLPSTLRFASPQSSLSWGSN